MNTTFFDVEHHLNDVMILGPYYCLRRFDMFINHQPATYELM
jgi:hypothetical protein